MARVDSVFKPNQSHKHVTSAAQNKRHNSHVTSPRPQQKTALHTVPSTSRPSTALGLEFIGSHGYATDIHRRHSTRSAAAKLNSAEENRGEGRRITARAADAAKLTPRPCIINRIMLWWSGRCRFRVLFRGLAA